jgi:hypothetical protein
MTPVRTNAADAPRVTLAATVWPTGDALVDVPVVLDIAISPCQDSRPAAAGPGVRGADRGLIVSGTGRLTQVAGFPDISRYSESWQGPPTTLAAVIEQAYGAVVVFAVHPDSPSMPSRNAASPTSAESGPASQTAGPEAPARY